ncbi:hypothetical protein PsorP6_010636 [Peronosclerospora sorghi]|uniref:Uncharacterized protein n=1 Tax=Peronosclerospora sorghi TaxID=230839 RepID=A0ACC0VWA1_9STRA|nr:hypothetical protein PsorP6_010636 [Peronosclerospora sorghi]
MTTSHQLQITDIDNESTADYAGSDVSLTEKVNIEEDESAAVAPYASEHNPVEEENDALHEETEGETVAVAIEDVSFNDDEKISNVAFDTDEDITAENIKTEAERVVEVA